MRRSFTAPITAGITALSLVTGTAAASAAPQSTPQASYTVVIDQFATHGPAGPADQYVQLQNISKEAVADLSNYTIEYSTGAQRHLLDTIPQGTTLRPGGIYVVINRKGFSAFCPIARSFDPDSAVTDLVGFGLVKPRGDEVVDGVATDPRSPFLRGDPAPTQPSGSQPLALVRVHNTDNNAVDFHIRDRKACLPGPDPQF
jgi:hypothetical protein